MAFSSFRWNVFVRILLIVGCLFVAAWGWTVSTWVATPLIAGLAGLLLIGELIRYVERTQRDLATFLQAVACHDYSVPARAPGKGRVFDEMQSAFRVLAAEFTRLNSQKAANYQYLESVVEHLGVALVCFDESGGIAMMNEPARKLFQLPAAQSVASFARVDARLPVVLEGLGHGDRHLLQLRHTGDALQLILYATSFSLLGKQYKLVSFQNIRDELEQREMESWQKLVRVLTHEIMNSVTPIVSLSNLIQETLANATTDNGPGLDAITRSDLQRSANAVQSRSSGLLDFVKAYRSFTTIPTPVPAQTAVGGLLENARILMADALAAQHVQCEIRCESADLAIHADPRQIEQVLINLMRNAIEAMAETREPLISLVASSHGQGRVMIQVVDNGPGIEPTNLDNIFVPFFTTKRGGTGVGLSISRQLVRANRGFISFAANQPRGCMFTLLLPRGGNSVSA
jgi:two-component system nitrogen regulation sensor histidine kinase NtrY